MLSINKTLSALFALGLLLFFASCDPQTDNTTTTVEEDKANVKQLFDDVVTQAEAIESGCGVQSFDQFFGLNNGVANNQQWVDMITRELERVLNYDYIEQTRELIFSNHTGTYQWDPNAMTFTYNNAPNNQIVVMAPSAQGRTTNNAEVTVSTYTQQSTTFDGMQYWFPNTADIDVLVDGSQCMGIDLKQASYDNGSFGMPTELAMDLMLAPFNFEINSSRTDGTTYDMKWTASNAGEKVFSLEVEMTFTDSDFSDFTSDDIDRATGTFTYGDFSMPFDVNIKALNDLLNPSQTQINEMIKVSVNYKGNKIADLEFQEGTANDSVIIIYRDNSTEDLYSEYKDLVERLEVVFSDFL